MESYNLSLKQALYQGTELPLISYALSIPEGRVGDSAVARWSGLALGHHQFKDSCSVTEAGPLGIQVRC